MIYIGPAYGELRSDRTHGLIDGQREQVDTCPFCNTSPHDTNHTPNCEENPTDLQPINLWTEPRKVAYFLKLMERNNDE